MRCQSGGKQGGGAASRVELGKLPEGERQQRRGTLGFGGELKEKKRREGKGKFTLLSS